ncbi:hypothetical protein T492DRAFT_1131141 [Pavlovales sp. CCMP2436]|nr:hypothetical protein T492DRAFT_1131141 [Pavlovales sp. CCMP2436]
MSLTIDSNNQNRMMDWSDTDSRNRTTHYLLNGQPYDGPVHPIFGTTGRLGSGAPQYWTGVHHHALNEKLVCTATPVYMPRNEYELLDRAERETNTMFNTFKPALFTDTLNDSAGVPIFSRTIIPERLQTGIPSRNPLAREQPFNDLRTKFAPRQGVGGPPDVLYNPLLNPAELRARALGAEPIRRPPPEAGMRAPGTYDPQPEYVPTQPMPDPLVLTPYYPPRAFQSPPPVVREPMRERTPVTSAPFRSPETPATASPRRNMQALEDLPAFTITTPTPDPPAKPPPTNTTPTRTRTNTTERNIMGQPSYVEYAGQAGPSEPYTAYVSPPAMSRRQKQLGKLSLGLTGDEMSRIGKLSDLRTRPPRNDQEKNAQIARLLNNEVILQKIIGAYGDLDTFMAMRRTGATAPMSNVYGSLNAAGLEDVFDPYAVTTDAVTLVSFTSSETPQNQMRDLAKVIKKKIPVDTTNTELVFPFNNALFTTPLTYVAEASLPVSLGLAVTKAVGVQWSFSNTKTISAGCAFVLGDTKQLENEATTDPKKSTFTVNHIVPSGTVAASTFQLTIYKYVPGTTQQRVYTWSSLDIPEVVCAKWKATMEPSVLYAGSSQSFGHAVLTYDRATGKYIGTFDANTAWGTFTGGLYYEIYRYESNDNPSKVNLGLNTSPTTNLFWNTGMGTRPFTNVASPAYKRSGVVVDSTQRITVEVLETGSQRTSQRQIKFDITRYHDELNGLLSFFNPAISYTMIFANSDIIYDIVFNAGSTQVAVNPEGSSSIAFYFQIYKPVIRFCGGVLVNSNYTGVVCPISRLSVISNEFRSLNINDFTYKRLPTTIGQDSYFSGDIIGRSSTGDSYNIVNNLALLNSELLLSKEAITILSCTATSDSWLITTNNQYTPFQVIATPAYNPTTINALNKASPPFASAATINTDPNWPVTAGWRTSTSSYYQNNAVFLPWKAFDRIDNTYWASAELAYSAAGVEAQWVQMDYPDAVKMVSHKINPAAFGTETFQFTAWQANKVEEFFTSIAHVPYKYWRLTVTLIRTNNAAIHGVLYEVVFNTGWSIGMTSLLSAQPVDLASFKLILGNSYGQAAAFGETLGYKLDTELSRPNTMVFVDQSGQPTIAHRGSVTAKDWLVDDALIAVSAHKNTDRLNLSRSITAAADEKYLGGRLAEQSGAGGQIVTTNKAAGLGDIGRRQPSGTRQTDVRVGNDAVSALSSLVRRPDSQPIVYAPQRGQANRFLPGPIRYLLNTAKSHLLGNFR